MYIYVSLVFDKFERNETIPALPSGKRSSSKRTAAGDSSVRPILPVDGHRAEAANEPRPDAFNRSVQSRARIVLSTADTPSTHGGLQSVSREASELRLASV